MRSSALAACGKSGTARRAVVSQGVRVIYYVYDLDMPIYALLIYGKNERADLTAEQRKSAAAFAAAIKAARKRS